MVENPLTSVNIAVMYFFSPPSFSLSGFARISWMTAADM
jgi:hypothetical protein